MFVYPMHLQRESVPFHVTRRGKEPILGVEHTANCKVLPVWVAWGEPGAKHYTAKPVQFCLN